METWAEYSCQFNVILLFKVSQVYIETESKIGPVEY